MSLLDQTSLAAIVDPDGAGPGDFAVGLENAEVIEVGALLGFHVNVVDGGFFRVWAVVVDVLVVADEIDLGDSGGACGAETEGSIVQFLGLDAWDWQRF